MKVASSTMVKYPGNYRFAGGAPRKLPFRWWSGLMKVASSTMVKYPGNYRFAGGAVL